MNNNSSEDLAIRFGFRLNSLLERRIEKREKKHLCKNSVGPHFK